MVDYLIALTRKAIERGVQRTDLEEALDAVPGLQIQSRSSTVRVIYDGTPQQIYDCLRMTDRDVRIEEPIKHQPSK